MNKLGEKIRGLRITKGLTPTQLARMIGVTTPYIHQIEKYGEMPSTIRVAQLAEALDADGTGLLKLRAMGKIEKYRDRINEVLGVR